jgi:predicted ATP-grasp superfamily ATP-dependent carboligase
MQVEPSGLVIVSSSGRALAESAVRGGYAAAVVDGFCDQDTRAVAPCAPVPLSSCGLDATRLRAEVERLAPLGERYGLIYGAGLEGAPESLDWLAERFPLLGNGAEVLRVLGQPARFFALLDDLEIPYPEIRFEPPAGHEGPDWLVKEAGTSGGLGVRQWRTGGERPARAHFFQRFLAGPVMSVLFVADGRRWVPIGVNRLMTATAGQDLPFIYRGAYSGATLGPAVREQLDCAVAGLVTALGLRGINGLDFIVNAGGLYLLEVNPRPCATLSLYEDDCPGGWVRRHVRACLGELPAGAPLTGGTVRGHRIVYAPQDLAIPSRMRWPAWAKDRPVAATRVACGAPLCTVLASATEMETVEHRLLQREHRILSLLADAGIFPWEMAS